MAKKSSERVMNIRKRDCDRISFVMEKDARYLIRAQALREEVTSSEVMRRAILARCGLDTMPDTSTPAYQAIKDAEIRPEAEEAIAQLQTNERRTSEGFSTYLVMIANKEEQDSYIVGLLDLLNAIEDITERPSGKSSLDKMTISKGTVMAVRRLLSNMMEVEPDDYDESEEPF